MTDNFNVRGALVCGRKLKRFDCEGALFEIVIDTNGTAVLRCIRCGGVRGPKTLNRLTRESK